MEPSVDDDSVDGVIIGRQGKRPRIEFQAKASSRDLLNNDDLVFPLPIKNYHDLRADTIIPRILIVLLMPEEEGDWLMHSEDALILKHCAYWYSLNNYPDTQNGHSVTVKIPRAQQLTSSELSRLMTLIEKGETL